MQIHPDTFNAIDRKLATGKVVAGATGVTLDRWSVGLALTYAMMVPMVWVMKMDTGVVFTRREDFEAVGGYNEERFLAEDVQFLMDLRKLGRKRGQGLGRATSAKAIVSTRKWDKYGDWHYFKLILTDLPAVMISQSRLSKFAQKYWYDDRK